MQIMKQLKKAFAKVAMPAPKENLYPAVELCASSKRPKHTAPKKMRNPVRPEAVKRNPQFLAMKGAVMGTRVSNYEDGNRVHK